MKATDLRQMTAEELNLALDETKQELFNLRLQQSLGQLEKPSRMKILRREIARIETIRTERKLEAKAGSAS